MANRSASVVGTYGAIVVPSTGVYAGAEDEFNFTQARGVETLTGRKMAIRREHYSWTNANGPAAMPNAFANQCKTDGCIFMLAQRGDDSFPVVNTGGGWGSNNKTTNGMGDITSGQWDSQFTAQFTALKNLNWPVIYNLWFEMNGSHNNYFSNAQGAAGTALFSPGTGETRYVNAWRHVRGLADAAGATINHGGKVLFTWCPQSSNNSAGWAQNYYPGDAYVDWIGWDMYRGTFSSMMDINSPHLGTGNGLYYPFAAGTESGSSAVGRGTTAKPFMICEAGYDDNVNYKNDGNTGDNVNYQKNNSPFVTDLLLTEMQSIYPNVVAYVYWNVNAQGHTNDIDSTPGALTAFKRFYKDSNMQLFYTPGSGGGSTAPSHGSPALSDSTPTQGQVLNCDSVPSSWNGSPPPSFTFQWQRDLANLSGQTNANYTVVVGDVGHKLSCNVTGTNPSGSFTASTVQSANVTASGTGGTLNTSPTAKTPTFRSSAWTQTNNHAGRTYDVVAANGVAYISGGSDLTTDNSGSSPVERSNTPFLSAYRMDTGAVIQTWIPNPNDECRKIWLSADKTKLYVCGFFSTIAGSTRHGVAALNTLTGPTDTTACTAQSIMPDLFTGGHAYKIILDEPNTRGWVLGNMTGGALRRIDLSAGAWRLSSGFTAPTITVTGDGLRCGALSSAGTDIIVSGQNVSPTITKCNANTGASGTFTYQPSSAPGLFEILISSAGTVYCMGGADAGDMVFVCTEAGAGPNSLVHASGTDNGYWFYDCDGNVQCACFGTVNGVSSVICGHHGKVCSAVKNNTAVPNTSKGIFVLSEGSAAGILQSYINPPDFGNSAATGSPLKQFGNWLDPATGAYHSVGDFTSVNSATALPAGRYARFDATASGVPVNTAQPTIDNTTPVVGDVLTRTTGTWSNTPTSYTTRWLRRDQSGSLTDTGATGTTYTVVAADQNNSILVGVKAVNASGTSTESVSAATSLVPGAPTAPPAPTFTATPPTPTTQVTVGFSWTDTAPVDHYIYQVTQDGVAGAEQTTTLTTVNLTLTVGHTYQFTLYASNATGQRSPAVTNTFAISNVTVATPTMAYTPSTPATEKSVGFAWTQSDETAGFTYATYLDPIESGYGAFSTGRARSYPGPLPPGTYTFHVKAKNNSGVVSSETTFTFTVSAPGGVGSPTFTQYPAQTDPDNTPSFTWIQ